MIPVAQATEAGEALALLPLHERLFQLVAIAIGGLLLLTTLFVLQTIWLRIRNARGEARWRRREALWTKLIPEALSGERSAEDVRDRIEPADHRAFLDFLLRFSREVKGPELDRLRTIAAPFLDSIVDDLADRRTFRRARAVQALGTLGMKEHETQVARALDDEAPLVAMLAARALAAHGTVSEHRAAVVARLPRFENWSDAYLKALLSGMGPAVAPRLRTMLGDRTQPLRSRRVAALALQELHDSSAADLAAELLNPSEPVDLLVPLLRLLGHVGRPEHLHAVLPLLEAEAAPVRAAAYQAVGALGNAGEAALLERGLSDPSPWVAQAAARGLLRVGTGHRLRAVADGDGSEAGFAAQVLEEAAGRSSVESAQ